MATIPQQENIDIGRVIQRGLSAIGSNIPGFALLALLLAGMPNFAMYYVLLSRAGLVVANPLDPNYWGTYGLLLLVTMFAGYLLQAALMRSVILHLDGRPADIGGSLTTALGLILPMIGLTIVSGIAIMLGLVLLIVPGVMLYVMWIVAVPVLVEERRGVFGSLSRSAELTKGSRWYVFGLLVLLLIFSSVVSAAAGLLNFGDPLVSVIPFAATNAVVAAVYGLVIAAMLASLYYELRTVKEGATTDSLASIFA